MSRGSSPPDPSEPTELERAEPRRDDEERFRATFNQITAGIGQADLGGRFGLVNQRFCEIVGRPLGELLHLRIQDITHPEDLPRHLILFDRMLASRQAFVIEKRYVRPDGSAVWVTDSVSLMTDAQGNPRYTLTVSIDISDRKRIEDERDRLAAIVASSHDAIIGQTLDGTIVTWNPAAEELFGYSAEEAIARPMLILMPAARADELLWISERLRRGERVAPYETVRLRKDGRALDVFITVSSIRDAEGRMVGVSTIARDITERKCAEKERARWLARERGSWSRAEAARRQLQDVLERITDGFVALDSQWRFVFLNREADRIFRRMDPRREDLIGQTLWEQFPELLGSRFDREYHRALAELVPVHFEEFYVPLNAWFEVHAYPAHDGLSVYLRDITDRKRANHERADLLAREYRARHDAEAATRAKDEFLAILSHELRAPLSTALVWLNVLRMRGNEAAIAAQALDTIEDSVRVLIRLVNDLLDVSRIIAGRLVITPEPVEVSRLIHAAVDAARPVATQKGIELESVVEDPAGSISADVGRLRQVLRNLLSNAITFTPPGGRIQVRARSRGSHAEITVRDTGQGISADLLPHIFERFRQGSLPSSAPESGLGLGLVVVKQLVELHGGTVQAESAGEGQGARFTVMLPRPTDPPAGPG